MEHGDLKVIRRSINDVRKKHFPTLPLNFDESLKQLLEMKQTLLHKSNQFCFTSDDNSVILFTCKNNLEMLNNNEHVLLMELLRMYQNISCNCIQFMFIHKLLLLFFEK